MGGSVALGEEEEQGVGGANASPKRSFESCLDQAPGCVTRHCLPDPAQFPRDAESGTCSQFEVD